MAGKTAIRPKHVMRSDLRTTLVRRSDHTTRISGGVWSVDQTQNPRFRARVWSVHRTPIRLLPRPKLLKRLRDPCYEQTRCSAIAVHKGAQRQRHRGKWPWDACGRRDTPLLATCPSTSVSSLPGLAVGRLTSQPGSSPSGNTPPRLHWFARWYAPARARDACASWGSGVRRAPSWSR